MMVCGIDPGLTGGIVFLGEGEVVSYVMPLDADGRIDVPGVVEVFRGHALETRKAFLEISGMRPDQNAQGAFKSGYSMGLFQGILASLGVSYALVSPRLWSAQFPHGVEIEDIHKRYAAIKVARREIVKREFPGVDLRKSERSTVAHDGLVDALLIAEYGRRQG